MAHMINYETNYISHLMVDRKTINDTTRNVPVRCHKS